MKNQIVGYVRRRLQDNRIELPPFPTTIDFAPTEVAIQLAEALTNNEVNRILRHFNNVDSFVVVGTTPYGRKQAFEGAINRDNLARATSTIFDQLSRQYQDQEFYQIKVELPPQYNRMDRVALRHDLAGNANCLVRCIQHYKGQKTVNKIYKRFPQLKPTPNNKDPIYIYRKDIETVAKIAGVTIKTYSGLGQITNTPWEVFNESGKRSSST